MQKIRKENSSFLGHKRNDEEIKKEGNERINEAKKPKEKFNKNLLLKKPKLYDDLIDIEKKDINLDENKEEKDNNIGSNNNEITNSFNTNMERVENKVCEKCGERNNVIIFKSSRSILEYLTDKKIIHLFKNSVISEKYYNLKYNKKRMICTNCIINLSKNQIEFQNFITKDKLNDNSNKEINEYPFDNLFNNLNLKNFNNKEKMNKNNDFISPSIKGKIEEIPQKRITPNIYYAKENLSMNSELNNIQKNNLINNNNHIFTNPNLNIGYVNTLNSQFVPYPNYNMPLDQNIVNTTLPNYCILNYPDVFKASHLRQPIGFITLNNNIPYFYNIPSLNMNISSETNNGISPNLQTNNKIDKEKNILEINNKNNNADNKFQNYHQNLNNLQTITEIQNKDFDEIFQSVSGLYHKLLNIKIYRDLNLDLIGQSQNKYQNLSPNCLSNTLTNASNINTIPYLNQINDIKNNNFKEYDANISKNVDNYMNIPVVTEMKKDALSKVNEFNNVYIQNKN